MASPIIQDYSLNIRFASPDPRRSARSNGVSDDRLEQMKMAVLLSSPAPQGFSQFMWIPPRAPAEVLARNVVFSPWEGHPGCYLREVEPAGRSEDGWKLVTFPPHPDGVRIFGRGRVTLRQELESGLQAHERSDDSDAASI